MTKIRGNTVSTTISPEAVLTKPGKLTEAQKAQARAKIGAAAEGGSVDLSNYYNKDEVNGLIPDVSSYQTEAQVQALINTAISNIPVYNGEVEDV